MARSPGRPFKPGRDERRGRGPRKGSPNAGRPPDWWKQEARALVESPEAMASLEALVKKGARHDPKLWFHVLDRLTDKLFSRPPVQVEGGDERRPLTIRLVRE
jgi:hypothetical protein